MVELQAAPSDVGCSLGGTLVTHVKRMRAKAARDAYAAQSRSAVVQAVRNMAAILLAGPLAAQSDAPEVGCQLRLA